MGSRQIPQPGTRHGARHEAPQTPFVLESRRHWSNRKIIPSRPLTRRETQVAVLTAMGMKEREIAAVLGVTPSTVNAQKYSMGRKFGGFNRVVVTHWAIQRGLVRAGQLAPSGG